MRVATLLVTALFLAAAAVAQTTASVADLQKAAEAGDVQAQFKLGATYANGDEGLPQDYVAAARWYQQAAAAGFAPAQLNLGNLYMAGRGVVRDVNVALSWWRKAAEQGNGAAQGNLGQTFLAGRLVPPDHAEAFRWLTHAVDNRQRMPTGGVEHDLGTMYEQGLGTAKDESKAADLYRRAADHLHPRAFGALARLYAEGRGVPKDDGQAYMWYSVAAFAEPDDATWTRERDAVGRRLSAEQQQAAQQRADDWLNAHKSANRR